MAKTVVGTPYYLSPEICESKAYNHKSDVWSAGCILYELACQRHAFEANSITALCRKILKGAYDDLPPEYSPGLRALVAAMLQQKPAARPAFMQILGLDVVQPALHSFLRRCQAQGRTVPYIDALLAAAVAQGPEAPLALPAAGGPAAAGGGGGSAPVAMAAAAAPPTLLAALASRPRRRAPPSRPTCATATRRPPRSPPRCRRL